MSVVNLLQTSALEELERRVVGLDEALAQVHQLLRHQLPAPKPHVWGISHTAGKGK